MKSNSSFNEKDFFEYFNLLIGIDSTTGQYEAIQSKICEMIAELGFNCTVTRKGGVIADLGGEGNPLAVTVHFDDIGLMVRKINPDGTLNVCPVGGLYPFYCVTENVRIYTRNGKVYTGSVCRTPGSIHVTEEELRGTEGDFRKNICVLLDLDVNSREDVEKYGIMTGDIVALEPRPEFSGGYIKSRYIDDKAAVALTLAAMKNIKETRTALNRKLYVYFAAYEEIGHGTSWLPEGVNDILAIDIAPTGPDQTSDEKKVSVFAKDSRFPYHWAMTNELIKTAKETGVDYAVDIFTPHYGTDCDTSIVAGYDVRHAAIGPGTQNSHGYERTHIDGIKNTYDLLLAYMLI